MAPTLSSAVRALSILGLALVWCSALAIHAQQPGNAESTDQAYRRGLALQQERRTLEAIAAYEQALKLDPFHARAHWEIGWSFWVLTKWPEVVRHWEIARDLKLAEPELEEYLQRARDQLEGKAEPLVRAPIGTRAVWLPPAGSLPGQKALSVELFARFQHYDPEPENPADRFDRFVFSPKSVHFAAGKVYVNALEGFSTLVFDPISPARSKVIPHRFEGDEPVFDGGKNGAGGAAGPTWATFPKGAPAERNRFAGKPVEFASTHNGRYLWVSYYRRDFDKNGVMPSAVAVIDTRRDEIVRVIDSGPIPKFLAASPDGHWLAVSHWGDNTVGLIDVSAPEPAGFRRAALITVGKRLSLAGAENVDRDRYCGYCLRGTVFTADSRYLLVGRMGGGGIAVLDVEARKYLGTVEGMPPTPRQLELSRDGERLYVGSNQSGQVSLYRTADLVQAARSGRRTLPALREGRTGAGTRTIALSPDGALVYAAVNNGSKVVVLDAETLEQRLEIPADSYPVGLAVSPDGGQLWVTSQGRGLRGGNSISVYRVSETSAP
jgi:YVTN family beta-propeller protein